MDAPRHSTLPTLLLLIGALLIPAMAADAGKDKAREHRRNIDQFFSLDGPVPGLSFEFAPDQLEKLRKDPRNYAAHRAVAGMSCGFGQSLTLTTGLMNVDRIAWIGALAADKPPAELVNPVLDDVATFKAGLKLLYLPIGKDDFLLKVNRAFSEELKKRGIPHEHELTDGGHSWSMYRVYIANFVGKIFKETK